MDERSPAEKLYDQYNQLIDRICSDLSSGKYEFWNDHPLVEKADDLFKLAMIAEEGERAAWHRENNRRKIH